RISSAPAAARPCGDVGRRSDVRKLFTSSLPLSRASDGSRRHGPRGVRTGRRRRARPLSHELTAAESIFPLPRVYVPTTNKADGRGLFLNRRASRSNPFGSSLGQARRPNRRKLRRDRLPSPSSATPSGRAHDYRAVSLRISARFWKSGSRIRPSQMLEEAAGWVGGFG